MIKDSFFLQTLKTTDIYKAFNIPQNDSTSNKKQGNGKINHRYEKRAQELRQQKMLLQ